MRISDFLFVLVLAGTHTGCSSSGLPLGDASVASDGTVVADGHADAGGTGGLDGGPGGSGGNGGTGGTRSCYDATASVSVAMKSCATDSDCQQVTVQTCCGSDLVVGLAKNATCSFPVPNCAGLGCAKFLYPKAEDGSTTQQGGTIGVQCKAGLCTSFVNQAAQDGGAVDSGAVDGGGSGACNSDSDCVFRPQAGCCGACLAQNDPVPASIPCGRMCPAFSSCACVNHRCSAGTLTVGSACEPSHDLCQAGTKCCAQCGGARPPDGGANCSAPVCTTLYASGLPATCPIVP